MKPIVTIVIPYAYTVKWLQILLSSLKQYHDDRVELWIMNNTPGEENSLAWMDGFTISGKPVKVIKTPHPRDWHAGCVDYALPMIETPYFMMMETDCNVCSPDWLDHFLNPMLKDDLVAMAGWFWPSGDRDYIGPGATIYNTKIVKAIREEVIRNRAITFCYGDHLKRRHTLEPRLADDKWLWGPFSETRGFHDRVRRDDKWWQEPCAWLYYRCVSQYECVNLPGIFTQEVYEKMNIASGTFYGAPDDIYFVHHWGGTVSHNWEKQKVSAPWEHIALPWWIAREDRLWNEIVPEDLRKKTLELGLVKTGQEEMDFILNHPNVIGVE